MDNQVPDSATTEAVQATPPAVVMQGFDIFSASGRATAVAGATTSVGAHDRCDYTVCTSTETLLKTLSVSASVSAEFGFGGVDAKSEFVQSLETTSTSVVVAIYASVIDGTTVATNPALAPGVKPPDAAGLSDFFQAYGDSFISSMTLGGEYIATYTFYSQTRTEQQQIVASLQAHGVTTSGSVSAGVTTAIGEVASSEVIRVSFSQQLFGYTGLALPTPDQVAAFALGLSAHAPNKPTVVHYDTEGYERVVGMNAAVWQPVIATRDLFTDTVAADAEALDSMLSQTAWLSDLYGTYGYTLDALLKTRAGDIKGDAATLKAFIRGMQKDPTQSYTAPTLPSLAYGLPTLNVTTPVLAAHWGRGGGAPWWDVNMQTVIESARLHEVRMWGAGYVDRIESLYGNLPPVSHGGGGGERVEPLVLQPGEFIQTISGRAGRYVDHLTLTTSKGQQRGVGGGGGDPFSWSVPAPAGDKYSVVIGFGGRADKFVDAIGPMTSEFSPATWQGPSSLEAAPELAGMQEG
ncbi:MAG: hypothetical protein QOH76_1026 [Thermoleophilaceae bacterium]|jgi:hypothetical protein|nr:hypothetical protein [Thermoleophilaceae bacterium]